MSPTEPEIYFPKLELIERLKVDSFFIARQHELAKKIDEIKVKDKKYWGWLIYGWMLNSVDEAEKIKPFVDDIPVLRLILKYYIIVMKFQARRLKQ